MRRREVLALGGLKVHRGRTLYATPADAVLYGPSTFQVSLLCTQCLLSTFYKERDLENKTPTLVLLARN